MLNNTFTENYKQHKLYCKKNIVNNIMSVGEY